MKIDVLHIAKLANLPLKKEEIEKYEKQLSSILEYIEKLQKVKTNNIPETSQVTNLENVTRDDATESSLSQDEALSNIKSKQNGSFKVKAILEQ
jgi:aspartyl-tRNA(Asn)/glutamyl-tRNA(Gln) amidotransferase subunit C